MVQKDCLNKKLLIICGPTASGKTALSIECARLLNSEVISADSMNVYCDLNVGTAKPTEREKRGIEHHLIDVVDKFGTFTVGDYKELARPICDGLIRDGKTPVVCGGTGFYINSLIYDLSYGGQCGNLKLRNYYKQLAEERGNEYVYEILKKIDAISAEKIHFNDLKRVIRALEICDCGTIKSEIKDDFTPIYNYDAYIINIERDLLYNRINKRVDEMINSGLVDEVKSLIDEGITLNNQCMQGIGYKEIYSYFKGEISLAEAIDLIKLNTRHYAKRQITFFKRLPNLKTVEFSDINSMAERIVKDL